jgi:hypothetical protein
VEKFPALYDLTTPVARLTVSDDHGDYDPQSELRILLGEHIPWSVAVAFVWCRLCLVSQRDLHVNADSIRIVSALRVFPVLDAHQVYIITNMGPFLAAAPSWVDRFYCSDLSQDYPAESNPSLEIVPWLALVGDTLEFNSSQFVDLLKYHLLAPFEGRATRLMFTRALTLQRTQYVPELIRQYLSNQEGETAAVVLGIGRFVDHISNRCQTPRYFLRLQKLAARYMLAYSKLLSMEFYHSPMIFVEDNVVSEWFEAQAPQSLEILVSVAALSGDGVLESLASIAFPTMSEVLARHRIQAAKVIKALLATITIPEDMVADQLVDHLALLLK